MIIDKCGSLARLIRIMQNGDQSGSRNDLLNDEYLITSMQYLSSEEEKIIRQVTDRLKKDLASKDVRHVDRRPIISTLLAYAHCRLYEQQHAVFYAKLATQQFGRNLNHWNLAISHWFLGVMYKDNNLLAESKTELGSAMLILEKISNAALRKFVYTTQYHCQNHINEIKQLTKELSERTISPQFADAIRISYSIFSELMQAFKTPPDDFYYEKLSTILSLDPSEVDKIDMQVGELLKLRNAQVEVEPIFQAFVDVFLSHCYNLSSYASQIQDQSTELFMEEAIDIFRGQQDQYNQALAHWYLALIYMKNSKNRAALSHLNETDNLLILLEDDQRGESFREVHHLREDLQSWIKLIPTNIALIESKSPEQELKKRKQEKKSFFHLPGITAAPQHMTPESTPFRKNESNVPQVNLRLPPGTKETTGMHQKSEEQKDTKKEDNVRRVQHIVIPVDVQALRELDTNSTPLEIDLIKRLQEYGEKRDGKSGKSPTVPNPKIAPPMTKRRMIPSFPIYGQAAAGPNGQPNLDPSDLEKAEIVYDDLCIVFNGKEHDVQFLDGTEYNFVGWKRYGWLEVVGESMNDSAPIPIKNGYYVLFAENRNVDSCVMRIVVAVLPEVVSQPAQLVIKRLLKLSTPLPSRTDGFASEYTIFLLHSESSYENDPRTGLSYKDIEIMRNDQIVGEVIAVAGPK